MDRTPFDDGDAWLDEVSQEDLKRIIDAMYRVHQMNASVTDYQKVLERILSESRYVAYAEGSSLLLYDETRQELYFAVTKMDTPENQQKLKQIRLRLDQGIAGEAATSRLTVNVKDATTDPRIHRQADETTGYTTRSLLAVPMVDGNRLVGVLEVVNKKGSPGFSDFDQRIVEMFASLATSIVIQAQLIDQSIQSERLAAIGQTVAGLSHYSKNILSGINGSAELIDESLTTDNPSMLKGSWDIMKRSIARLSSVIEDMLAYSKERKPVKEWYSATDLLEDAILTAHSVMERQQIEIRREFKLERSKAYVDGRGIHRCLLNLLLNAVDAIGGKHGIITVRGWMTETRALVIEVEDNGPGIPDDVIGNVFKPFYSTKGSRGTGLGLAVTQKIVVEHGGMIKAGRGETGGARFTIVLPAPKEA